MLSLSDFSVILSSVVVADLSDNVGNTVIGAVIIAGAIAVTKVLDTWWTHRREDQKSDKEDKREDVKLFEENKRASNEQLFRLQEAFIQDLFKRIEALEKDSREKDSRLNSLTLSHQKCQEDHEESKLIIEGLKREVDILKSDKK